MQQIVAENLPAIPLVSPNILVGAKKDLGRFRPAIMEHYTLWNIEELYWRDAGRRITAMSLFSATDGTTPGWWRSACAATSRRGTRWWTATRT